MHRKPEVSPMAGPCTLVEPMNRFQLTDGVDVQIDQVASIG